MIVDSSALLAIAFEEPEGLHFKTLIIASRSEPLLSAASYVESSISLASRSLREAAPALDSLLEALAITVVAVTPSQARLAAEAWRVYGKRSGHPAKLNFGDCLTYALAAETGQPLLFKGDDFIHTDLALVTG